MDVSDARALLASAVAAGATPAAVVEVGTRDGPRWQEAFGRLSAAPDADAASIDVIFDLASLTKVIATTSLAMRAADAGHLDLEARVGAFLTGWRHDGRSAVRVRHLLDHSSGLPGHARLWERAHGRAGFLTAIADVPLEHPPGTRAVYSDLGFIALGLLLEAMAGDPLDRLFEDLQRTWGGAMSFSPARDLGDRIAPTELDPDTGAPLHGTVHDENARAMEGIAGHAGLFGTAAEVGTFARLVLRTFDQPTALGSPATMRRFAARSAVPDSSRALGWDTMRPTSSCGRLLSSDAIGHTGFTGTSLWIDRRRDLYVVLLTNRVHPTRANDALLGLRPLVHEAIVRAADGGRGGSPAIA